MDTNILKYKAFVEIAECGSFTEAAARLSYSQSGVSRMIHDLEKEWNVMLLTRSRAGVCLTSEGERLLPYAKSLCREFEKLQAQIEELNGLETGLIRIGTFSSVATHWLPNIIRAFREDYPGIDYELLLGDYEEIENWTTQGRVDCSFLRLPTRSDFDAVFLERDVLLAVLPEAHPLTKHERVPVSELCTDPFLLLQKGGQTDVSEIFASRGLTPSVQFTTWDDYAIMSMVESGLGVSILPRLILRRVPYRIAVRELDVPAFREIGFVVKDNRAVPLAVRKFTEYLDCRNCGPADEAGSV